MTRSKALDRLEGVFAEARRRSLIGNLSFAVQRAHSEGFLRALWLENVDGPVLELGSGGGLPGLVLAVEDQDLHLVLLDSARRSADFLRWAVEELQLSSRVEVVNARAEQLGREEDYRGSFTVVVARSFGPPAVTAECAAPLLRVGGRLIVSEPPGKDSQTTRATKALLPRADRWPAEGCEKLGLTPELDIREAFGFAVLRQVSPCSDRYPRRPGIPAKRPLFSQEPPAKPTSR
jgi:16S rRNA (guanine527-N7)-methyltransferase